MAQALRLRFSDVVDKFTDLGCWFLGRTTWKSVVCCASLWIFPQLLQPLDEAVDLYIIALLASSRQVLICFHLSFTSQFPCSLARPELLPHLPHPPHLSHSIQKVRLGVHLPSGLHVWRHLGELELHQSHRSEGCRLEILQGRVAALPIETPANPPVHLHGGRGRLVAFTTRLAEVRISSQTLVCGLQP